MWDLAIDGESGDLMFGPSRDLLGATGSKLTDQRIIIRCRIARGTFTYDETGTLGSRLMAISNAPLDRQMREASSLIQEALEPMTDISVGDIDIGVDENNRMTAIVHYGTVVRAEEGEAVGTQPPVEFSTFVAI